MTTSVASEGAKEARLRRLARKHGLLAEKSRRDGLWYILDPYKNTNLFLEAGLNSALEWLEEYVGE